MCVGGWVGDGKCEDTALGWVNRKANDGLATKDLAQKGNSTSKS